MSEPLFTHFLMADLPPSADGRETNARGRLAQKKEFAGALDDLVEGRSVLLNLRSALSERDREAVKTLLEQVVKIGGALSRNRQEEAIGKLADLILPDPLGDARGSLAADNLDLRDRFIVEFSSLTGIEVGTASGLDSRNPYATAARWKRNADVFSVHHRGTERFPAFQFRDGRPHPTIKKVLKALPDHLSPWQRAFWFVSTNGWLDDAAPVSRLDDPQALVAAARRDADELVG